MRGRNIRNRNHGEWDRELHADEDALCDYEFRVYDAIGQRELYDYPNLAIARL
jgi:hypothetical protein